MIGQDGEAAQKEKAPVMSRGVMVKAILAKYV